MKKLLVVGVIVAASALVLAGCTGADSNLEQGVGLAPNDLEASITYGYWNEVDVDGAVSAAIDAFNEEYPNISVEMQPAPYDQYYTKLQTEASSGTLPDVFVMEPATFGLYASNGQLAPIDNLIDADAIDPANFPEPLVAQFELDGHSYAVPNDIQPTSMALNTALFAEAGVDLPSDDWTWKDYERIAAEITAALGSQGVYGTSFELYGQFSWYATIAAAGGSVISADHTTSEWDSAAAREGVQLLADLVAAGSAPTVQQTAETPGFQWFGSGRSAMYPASTLLAIIATEQVGDNLKVIPMPKGAVQATVASSLTNVVSAKSANLQAAQAFQAFLASKEAQEIYGQKGVNMPAHAGTQQSWADTRPNLDLQGFLDSVAIAIPMPVSRNTTAWSSLELSIIPKAISGELSIDDATAQLVEQMDAALKAE